MRDGAKGNLAIEEGGNPSPGRGHTSSAGEGSAGRKKHDFTKRTQLAPGRRVQLLARAGHCRPEATTVQLDETVFSTKTCNCFFKKHLAIHGPAANRSVSYSFVQFRTALGRFGQDWAGLGRIGQLRTALGSFVRVSSASLSCVQCGSLSFRPGPL